MSVPRDSRHAARFPVSCEVRGVRTQAQGMNISGGGLMVVGPELLAVGSIVTMRFSLGAAGDIELKGFVRHAVKEKGCGVEFIEVLPQEKEKLNAYLASVAAAAPATPASAASSGTLGQS